MKRGEIKKLGTIIAKLKSLQYRTDDSVASELIRAAKSELIRALQYAERNLVKKSAD